MIINENISTQGMVLFMKIDKIINLDIETKRARNIKRWSQSINVKRGSVPVPIFP